MCNDILYGKSIHITWSENTPPSAKVALLLKLDAESARGLVQGTTVMSARCSLAYMDASNPLPDVALYVHFNYSLPAVKRKLKVWTWEENRIHIDNGCHAMNYARSSKSVETWLNYRRCHQP